MTSTLCGATFLNVEEPGRHWPPKERFQQRVTLAQKYPPDFGLSAPCGFGRESPAALSGLLRDHLDTLELL